MFGGSTMFGSYQRDAKTLPSLVAEALAPAGSVRVLNFGETGYVFTQEVLELMLQLRSGARPRVVLFYDGINDVASAVQNGVAGIPQNERNRERDFQLGLTAFSWRHDIGAELRALGSVVEIASYRSALSQWVLRLVRRQQWEGPDPEELAPRVIDTYVDTARLVETLANAYNFQAIYVWQPTLHSTDKRLTTYESTLMGAIDADPYHVKMKAVHGLVSRSIDHAMAGVASGRFLNLSALFAGEGAPVFVDEIGHTTEEANKPLVEAMLPLLRAALTDLPPRSQGGRQGEK